jgi:nucleoside-diphosphate-sugar epimerase
MRVLFTGADGYIGAVLGPKLLERGYEAIGIDTGFYRRGWLFDDCRTRPMVLSKDVRRVAIADLQGIDAVVHLAELSNDPIGENDPGLTYSINFQGSSEFARLCKAAGVSRFIYSSSCSIYGAGGAQMRTETAAIDPQTAYARCKVLVEQEVRSLANNQFTPVFLRNATAFGASPRQRFDLVLNNLAAWAYTAGEIRMTSDGSPWRPIVHVEDICEAILCAIEAPVDAVTGQAFNVGDDAQNYRVRDIADIVGATFPGCRITYGANGADNRSYRVSFAKIRAHMPAFRCRWSAERGAAQLHTIFRRIGFDAAMFNASSFTRLSELKYLQNTQQVDPQLFWTAIERDSADDASKAAA